MCPVSTAWDMSEEVAASSTCFLTPMMPMVVIVKERRLQTNVLLVYMIRVSFRGILKQCNHQSY